MDCIFTDHNHVHTGFLSKNQVIDIDIGETNDFEIKIPLSEYDPEIHMDDGYIFIDGTELGGRLSKPTIDTDAGTVTFRGVCWRGMLESKITQPPANQDYLVISGELNRGLADIFGATFYGGLFRCSNIDTGITASVQINRYSDYLDAGNQFLSKKNHRINIETKVYADGNLLKFYVEISAVPVTDYSDEIENSQDGGINFKISKASTFRYTHIIGLGSGNLKDRIVVAAEILMDGSIREVPSIPDGEEFRTYKYDYPNAQDRETLVDQMAEKAKTLNDTDSQSITIRDNLGIWIGDIVGGRDYVTGTYIKEPIKKIIYRYADGVENFSYQIGV